MVITAIGGLCHCTTIALQGKTLYVLAILASFFTPWISVAIYVIVALMWLIPDRRIERVMGAHGEVGVKK